MGQSAEFIESEMNRMKAAYGLNIVAVIKSKDAVVNGDVQESDESEEASSSTGSDDSGEKET